jgi:predicted alpha-1,6-mannanase (GH76 family)
MVVLQSYYDDVTGLYNSGEWWRGANMLETTIEYSRQTSRPDYIYTINNTFELNKTDDFINDFYDDMGWWALAWVKAYDFTHQQKYLDMAKTIFEDMTNGWDAGHCGGGIYLEKTGDAKVAIANELFLTLAARLHLRTQDDSGPGSYLDWAQRTWAWFQASALIGTDNQVINSIDSDTCDAGWDAKFTSNQGVILGGLVDLFRATDDQTLLDKAIAIADAALENQVDEAGILIESTCHPACGGGDELIFKGAFIRNLAYLYEAAPLPRFKEFLIRQSDAIWELSRSEDNEFGQDWTGPFDSAGPARQAPALDAIIGAIRAAEMNLSLDRTVEGIDNCGTPYNAIDGNNRTKWCAAADNKGIIIDLGERREVVGFVVRHAEDGGETSDYTTDAYDASLSLDGTTWTQVVEVNDNTEPFTKHHFPAREARYVQLYVRTSQPGPDFYAIRIYEFEALGFDRAPLN